MRDAAELHNLSYAIGTQSLSMMEDERMVHRLLELFNGLAVIVDSNGIIEHCNRYMVWLAGEESSLIGSEFATICQPAESQSELREIFGKMQQYSALKDNVLCKVRLCSMSQYLVNWKIGCMHCGADGLKKVVLLGYNIGEYKAMHNFDPIVSPFASPGVFIVQDGKFKFWNSRISFHTGIDELEMIDYEYLKIIHPEDRDTVANSAADMLKGIRVNPYEYRYITKSGEVKWAMESVVPVVYGGRRAALGYCIDITQKKNMELNIAESENIYRTIFENSGTAMVMFDDDFKITMVNREAELLSGYSWLDIQKSGKILTDFVCSDDLAKILNYHKMRIVGSDNVPNGYEFSMVARGGIIKKIFFTVSIIPGTTTRIGSLIDITARRQAEDKLKFLSIHDKLTGLYNRRFFEEQLEAIRTESSNEFSLVGCDIDGLKLINDTFGHIVGDDVLAETGHILQKCCGDSDVVARTGGDEFAILMRGAGYPEVERVCSLIRQAVVEYNRRCSRFPLSLSLGFAVSQRPDENPYDLFKIADDNMYREKLLHGQSIRSNIVQIAMKALGERDFITEGHAERLRTIVSNILKVYKGNQSNASDMLLLAEFHDIGKVGIPDNILFKRGPLTDDEYKTMQRHCEIGQRIALSSPDLAPIADLILKHHERWDGDGYPLRLKGENIPLACRILAIADSYDAMTSDRPYRMAMSHHDALTEVRRCSGSQFDPKVVEVFMQIFEQGLQPSRNLKGRP